MTRESSKYPAVFAWAAAYAETAEGAAAEAAEDIAGAGAGFASSVNPANAEKFARLRERKFLTEDGHVNIMVVKEPQEEFFARIPALSDGLKARFADKPLTENEKVTANLLMFSDVLPG